MQDESRVAEMKQEQERIMNQRRRLAAETESKRAQLMETFDKIKHKVKRTSHTKEWLTGRLRLTD